MYYAGFCGLGVVDIEKLHSGIFGTDYSRIESEDHLKQGQGAAGLDDAYRLMGLRHGASSEEVKKRYREMAHLAHPDQGGTDTEMAELADAYASIRASRDEAGVVIPRNQSDPMVRASAELARKEELRNDSQTAFDAAIRHQTSRLKQAKRQGTWIALASGGLGVIIAFMRTLNLDSFDNFEGREVRWISSSTRLSLILICLAISGVFAFLAWRASLRATWIETALEDFSDNLSDKNSFLRLIGLLSSEANLPSRWTRDDLTRSISLWSRRDRSRHRQLLVARSILGLVSARAGQDEIPLEELARVAGQVDTAKLIISKGLERELIEERPVPDDPHAYAYTLTL